MIWGIFMRGSDSIHQISKGVLDEHMMSTNYCLFFILNYFASVQHMLFVGETYV